MRSMQGRFNITPHAIMLSMLLAASAAYHPPTTRILRAAMGVAPQRHRPVRLDLEEVGAKAKSALDSALADLAEEGAASATKPYLTQEERDRVLAETTAKRFEGAEPPSAPPPSNLPPEVDRGLTLSPDAIEARLSAPVAPSPPRSPSSAPSSPRVDRPPPPEFDGNVRKAGAKPLTQQELGKYAFEGLTPAPTGGPDYRPPPPPPPGAIRLVRLNGLERANFLLLVVLVAAGFGNSSPQVLDPELVGTLRLAAAALLLGHAAVAAFGVTRVLDAPPPENGQEKLPVLWGFKLLVTGPAGLLSLLRELAGK